MKLSALCKQLIGFRNSNPNKIHSLLTQATKTLNQANIHNATKEAEWLLEYITQKKISNLYLNAIPLAWHKKIHYSLLIRKRSQGTPLAYLTHEIPFLDFQVKINRHVLIPRPETEELCVYAQKWIVENISLPEFQIMDLGTGSGVIALALARKFQNQSILACDLSSQALKIAKTNAQTLQLKHIHFYAGNFLEAFPKKSFEKKLLIVCNPPYIGPEEKSALEEELSFEPKLALFSEKQGTASYQTILKQMQALAKPNSVFISEMGSNQSEILEKIFSPFFKKIFFMEDLQQKKRFLFAIDFVKK